MSDFRAKIIAELDDRKIPSQLKKISKENVLTLSRITLDTSGLPSQIQGSLDKHKFSISLDGIKMANIESQGQAAGKKYSQSLVENIKRQLGNGGIDSAIAQVTARYEKLGSSGHQNLSKISKDIELLNRLQSEMSGATSSTELVDGYIRYNDVLKRIKNNLSIVAAESKTFVSTLEIQNLDNNIVTWMERNQSSIKDFGESLSNLRLRLDELNNKDSSERFRSELDKINEDFIKIKTNARVAGKTGASFGHTIKGAFKSIVRYVSVSTIIYQTIKALGQMYNNIVEINSAMTELKKVTNETSAAYDRFLTNAAKKAQKIGSTMTAYINATSDFARLGYSMTDAAKLAETATIYSVVGDDIESIDDATQSIISTMTAFKISTSDAMSIVDKFNEVGNRFAISSGNIGVALQHSASSLAAANNTLDESIALITAAQTVVQDASVVGNAFKTISMRIRAAKTELEDAGLETDGMAESTASLRKEILALAGVDIMANDNTFKSTYAILDELSNKWKDLTDIQQASITELIAGKRQGQVISAIMENFNIARSVLSTSANSEGSAIAEHEKWLDSLEAKINQFIASWQRLSQVVLSDNLVGQLIDGASGLLDVLSDITDSVGSLSVAIAGIGIYAFIKNFD